MAVSAKMQPGTPTFSQFADRLELVEYASSRSTAELHPQDFGKSNSSSPR